MKWFKHDSTANMDAKLQEVLLDYGLEGYGLYWYCLELIAGKVEPGNLTFELEHDCRIIARNTGSTAQRVQEMMTRFVDLGLFENSQGTITCLKMAKVSDDYTAKLIRSEQSVKKPQVIENKGVLQTPTNSEKVSLEENRTEENKTENNSSGTSADAPCSVCDGNSSPIEDKSKPWCSHCKGTGKDPQPDYTPINQPEGISGAQHGRLTKPEKPKRKTKADKLFDKVRESGFLFAQASDEVLTEWCKLRTRKGASDSDLVHNRIDGQLHILINHGMTIDAALTEQVARNWTDLKAEWFDVVKNGFQSKGQFDQQPQTGWSAGLEKEIWMGDK